MELLGRTAHERLTPARLWSELDLETRRLAARALYEQTDGPELRTEADRAIAAALRFREAAVRQMPRDKRAEYLARTVRPSDGLAGSLLTALHLVHRREMLGVFLDELGIPQQDGVIDADHALEPVGAERLAPAVSRLRATYAPAEVDLYLASLLAIDPDVWRALREVLDRPAA
jgi:hypothetical protein